MADGLSIQTFSLPDNTIFMAANTLAMIYNWVDNTERRLPNLPNGVRVNYPWSAGAVLLPLTPEKYVLISLGLLDSIHFHRAVTTRLRF
jgi:hypothetical protein